MSAQHVRPAFPRSFGLPHKPTLLNKAAFSQPGALKSHLSSRQCSDRQRLEVAFESSPG